MKKEFSWGGIIALLLMAIVVLLGTLVYQNNASKANGGQSEDEAVVDTVATDDPAELEDAAVSKPVAKVEPAIPAIRFALRQISATNVELKSLSRKKDVTTRNTI